MASVGLEQYHWCSSLTRGLRGVGSWVPGGSVVGDQVVMVAIIIHQGQIQECYRGGGGGVQQNFLQKGGGGGESNHLLRAICIGNEQNI